MNHRVAIVLAIGVLVPVAGGSPQAEVGPAALLERAYVAHGGVALDQVTTYREVAEVVNEPAGSTGSRRVVTTTLFDLRKGHARVESHPDGGPPTVVAVGPWGSAIAIGDGPFRPLADSRPSFLSALHNTGLLALRGGANGRERLEAVEKDPLGTPGLPGVRVTTSGTTTTYWMGPDGRIDHEQASLDGLGNVMVRYRDYAPSGGIMVPRSVDYLAGINRTATARVSVAFNEPLPDLTPALFTVDPRLFNAGQGAVPAEASAWIREKAVPLDRVDARGSRADLQSLTALVAGARIVGLGEATYGTSEFFRVKHRLLESLVKDAGFNVFAVEALAAHAERINQFVQTGRGDARKLMHYLVSPTWQTEEALDLILWVRSYNQSVLPGNRLQFRGLDMQASSLAIADTIAYLRRASADFIADASTAYDCFRPYADRRGDYRKASAMDRAACRASIATVRQRINAARAELEARTSARDFLEAEHTARLVEQTEQLFASGDEFATRNAFMAENVTWLASHARSGAKLVLWAHNANVGSRQATDARVAMGDHLRSRFGDEYLRVGFAFSEGSFNSYRSSLGDGPRYEPLGPNRLPPPAAQSIEAYLASSGLPRFILDLRDLKFDTAATAWLGGLRLMRSVGATYSSDLPATYQQLSSLPSEFDLVIYLRDTTPSRLLP